MTKATASSNVIERSQTGVRMEKRILKVLKGLAEYHDITLGDLLEGIVLHAFEGKAPFGAESLQTVAELKRVYGLDLTAAASHRLREGAPARWPASPPRARGARVPARPSSRHGR